MQRRPCNQWTNENTSYVLGVLVRPLRSNMARQLQVACQQDFRSLKPASGRSAPSLSALASVRNNQITREGEVDVSTNAIANSDASSLLYRPAEATHVYTARPAYFVMHYRMWTAAANETNYGHFGPKTLRTLDTSALVWWVRTVRTDRHWCRSVLKTVRT